ncbi:MAG: chromosome segregation protein SMC [Ruminococcus sp.]|nr:chromosome segregation protein SMC [Ruminococcus sp.]MDD6530753.1 chromosome segregation protein SMC [Ruminococcus sp.]
MLLKSLELHGFKTFPDRIKLSFDKGITSIVGPNGSGKSNISDAIRWVLGEQSAKTLRCSKMEDVVFNGTDKRKKTGYAEVTLSIDNKDRILPFDGDEVAVTRRYYRSGESEYMINKATVRLRDIHELFMDTGLGRDGYSMIGQGKIDSIVASKSEERREIFEEASGISRYRYRKTEAERKLKSTEENLVRLRDIVGELEDRVGPLKKQSEKAQKFLVLSEEKKGLEIALWLNTLDNSANIIKEQDDKIDIQRAQYENAEQELANISSETESIYLKNGEITSKIDTIRRNISQFESEVSNNNALISVANNDIEHNKETINRLETEIEQLDNSFTEIESQIKEKKENVEKLKLSIEEKQKEYNEVSENLNTISVDASRSGDELQELNSKLAELSQKSANAKVVLLTSDSSINELNKRIESLNSSLSEKESNLETTSKMLEDYKAQGKDSAEKVEMLSNSIKGLELKINNLKARNENSKGEIDRLTLDSNEKLRRANILEDLEKNLEGFAHSVKTVMNLSRHGKIGGIHGPVSRLIKVPTDYAVAIETALGGAMQNIVTGNEEDAKRAIRTLKENKGGRATFLPIATIKPRYLNENGIDSCFGFVGVASDLCDCKDEYKGILQNLLGKIVIAEDLNSAVSIAKKYSYRFKVVTLDGQVVNAGGSLTGGSLNKRTGLLSRASEIEKYRKEAKALADKANELKEQYSNSQQEFAKYEADILGTRGDLSTEQQELIRLRTEYKACQNEYDSLVSSIDFTKNEIVECENKISNLQKDKETADREFSAFEEEIANIEKTTSNLTGNRLALTEKREQLSEKLQNIRLEIVTFEKDKEALISEIRTSEYNSQHQTERKENLRNQIVSVNSNIDIINKKIESYTNISNNYQDKIAEFNNAIEKLNGDKEKFEKKSVELRQKEKDLNSTREVSGRELARLEERKINLQKQYDDIIAKLWDEYELTKRQAEEISIEIENVSTARKRLNEIKSSIRGLGSVNVSAIEEYKEVSERYEFLGAQVSDVEKSKNEIERLINDLTKQMKDAFIENFHEINKHFGETFKELFGGGTASLELANPDDILNSGIDIIAHPPGKIVVHLEALSGGEKALVAIALYFSIMKVRPAPFCVMDEIEAALDDVNVDRFAQYMRRMTDRTQFITITHRRGTMEESDVLYGVTMQDEGISKLLELRASEVAAKLGMKAN